MKETPFEKRTCKDCAHLIEVLSLWCGNEQAIKDRGTRIPGCIHCPHWAPDWKHIHKQYKTAENGYKSFWSKIKSIFKSANQHSLN